MGAAFYVVLLSPAREQYCDFPLVANPSVLGREPGNAVVVHRDDISRQHAELIRRGTQWHLADLNSTNGTYVNGEQVFGSRVIASSTHFMLGNSEFVLLERDDPSLQRYRRYYNERRHDPLTSLRNEDALRDAVRDASKTEGEISLVMFEIDDFARVNSELGREQGDVLLKEVAGKLALRVTVPIYRHRGPRFAVLLETAATIKDEIRYLIDDVQNAVAASGFERPIRLSAGISSATDRRILQLVRLSERALEQAQRLGGGRVWFDSEEVIARSSVPGIEVPDVELTTSVELPRPVLNFVRLTMHALVDALRVGQWLFAVEVRDRQVLAITNERQFEELELALDQAVRDAVLAVGGGSSIIVGQGLNAHPVFVALAPESARSAAQLTLEIESRFTARSRERGVDGKLVVTRPVVVSSGKEAIAQATKLLAAQSSDERVPWPLPIGIALRSVGEANEHRFFALVRLHQAVVRWLFSVFAAELLRRGHQQAREQRLQDTLRQPVSDHAWVKLLRSSAQELARVPREELVIPVLVDMVVGSENVLIELERFATARNKFAHGHDVREQELYDEWLPKLQTMLSGTMAPLAEFAVRYVERVDMIEDSAFDVHFRNLVGDNVVAERTVDRRSKPIPVGRIVVDGRDGALLSLSPFAVYGRCPTCHTEEVFFLDRLVPNAVFKSLREGGHEMKRLTDGGIDPRIAETIKTALDKALFLL